ncbi:hypothetical protein Z945_2906 [Sulfitobacter noctilucae]|nr:hypothetical protein Z945_2906 [Sulfitobacter noctilucae]
MRTFAASLKLTVNPVEIGVSEPMAHFGQQWKMNHFSNRLALSMDFS